MEGPFALKVQFLDQIPQNSSGVYLLSLDGHVAIYVGRSESDLKNELLGYVEKGQGYSHFWFEIATSSLEAYGLECKWYHQYQPKGNLTHPAVSPGATWKCPVAGCLMA